MGRNGEVPDTLRPEGLAWRGGGLNARRHVGTTHGAGANY